MVGQGVDLPVPTWGSRVPGVPLAYTIIHMGKQENKRIELAKRILDTTDTKTLDMVAHVLGAGKVQPFTEAEIEEFEAIAAGMRDGTIKSIPWKDAKAKALRAIGK